jgi:hypothetical protein
MQRRKSNGAGQAREATLDRMFSPNASGVGAGTESLGVAPGAVLTRNPAHFLAGIDTNTYKAASLVFRQMNRSLGTDFALMQRLIQ